jgi:hypothetical protein
VYSKFRGFSSFDLPYLAHFPADIFRRFFSLNLHSPPLCWGHTGWRWGRRQTSFHPAKEYWIGVRKRLLYTFYICKGLLGLCRLAIRIKCSTQELAHTAKNRYRKFETNVPQKRNCAAAVPISTFMCLWAIYILPRSICLFCCRKICGLNLEIYKSLKYTWMWKLGLRPRNS